MSVTNGRIRLNRIIGWGRAGLVGFSALLVLLLGWEAESVASGRIAGYPFGSECAGPAYASPETYLRAVLADIALLSAALALTLALGRNAVPPAVLAAVLAWMVLR